MPPTQRPQNAAEQPALTLEWHKQNFLAQREAWRKKALEAAASASQANAPLPAQELFKVVNADRGSLEMRLEPASQGTLRVVNPDLRRMAGSTGSVSLSRTSSVGNSIRRKPVPESRMGGGEMGVGSAGVDLRAHTHPVPQLSSANQPQPRPQKHTRTSLQPGSPPPPNHLSMAISVYDFRSTIPECLRPASPPLRWDNEPAPQLPPVEAAAEPGLYADEELVSFMTANKAYLQAFVGSMPVATKIVKGKLKEVVEG